MAMVIEKDRRLLEAQCKDAQARADEAEVNALKGGKKAMIKMETRIRELESEIDAESRKLGDASKNLRKTERKVRSSPLLPMRTRRTMSACRPLLTSSRARLSPTRSRSRRLRKLQLSISPSIGRLLVLLVRQRPLLTRVSRPLPA